MALRILTIIVFALVLIAGGGSGTARANPGAGDSKGEKLVAAKTIEEALGQHAPSLLAITGVVGVAQGQCGNRPCLRVYVLKKTPELEQKIPATLEGYPVVVEESGEIRALPEKSGDPKGR